MWTIDSNYYTYLSRSHFPCRNSASRQYCLMVFPYVQFLVVSVPKSVSQVYFGEVCITTWSSHLKLNWWFHDILSCKSSVAVKSLVSFRISRRLRSVMSHLYCLVTLMKKRQKFLLSTFINRESTFLTAGKKILSNKNYWSPIYIYFYARGKQNDNINYSKWRQVNNFKMLLDY